jgi:hypothetical protein
VTGDPVNRDQERLSVAAGTAGQNENEARWQAKITKAKVLPRSDAVAGAWVELPEGGWINTSVEYPEASDDVIALDKVYCWISSLEQQLFTHGKQGRFQVRKFRRSAVGRQLAKFFMQPASLVGQKKSVVSRKNNRTPFELWVYERHNTKKNEHEQNHGHPKYSYKQFRGDLMNERSKESSAYADLLRPRGRCISGEALRRIVERVTSKIVKKST